MGPPNRGNGVSGRPTAGVGALTALYGPQKWRSPAHRGNGRARFRVGEAARSGFGGRLALRPQCAHRDKELLRGAGGVALGGGKERPLMGWTGCFPQLG
jgi:hypothetical protein